MSKVKLLVYDHESMLKERVGAAGVRSIDLTRLSKRLEKVRIKLKQAAADGSLGWLNVPEQRSESQKAKSLAKKISAEFKTLVVIGIGGSDLGTRTLVRALKPAKRGLDVRFIGSNTDPEEIADLLRTVDLKTTLLNVVSKSGGTIESMSTFLLLRDRLIRRVGLKSHVRQVVATTDQTSGVLRTIAEREGYTTLPVPDGIGGRFSVLTPVGLFPAACAGIAVDGLLRGAAEIRDSFLSTPVGRNDVLNFAGLHYLGYAKRGQRITVLMPYAARLNPLSSWFRQLWGESLGKEINVAGRMVSHGLTPVAALGATDQHSQIQLYNEGPFDKLITFIEVGRMRDDFNLPNPFPDLEDVSYFSGKNFSEILRVERRATSMTLEDNGRPNGVLYIPEISPETIGGLMTFFMLSTAVMADLLDVNAYNQPGVEKGKRIISALLGRKGYKL